MLTTVTLTLLEGLLTTLELFALTLLLALPLGLVISFGSMSTFAPLRYLMKTIVWVIRGTPLMIQILIIFYGPGLLFGLPLLPRFTAALVSFAINYACYFSEIYRGGIQSVPQGQYEAGQVLGMTRSQIFFRITLLQVIKRIVPPLSNEFITLVNYLDGRDVHQKGDDLAPVLYRRVLSGGQRHSDPALRLGGTEAGLLQVRRGPHACFGGT